MEVDGNEDHNNENQDDINYLVFVHPSQYERILRRREERNRLMERRGRARQVHLPIVPLDYLHQFLQYQNNGMPCDQYGNYVSPNVLNYLIRNNHMLGGYVNDPRAASMSGVNVNAMNFAQAYYRNLVYQNIMYNRYYGYRDCNGRPVVPGAYLSVRRIGPYDSPQNVNGQAGPANATVSNAQKDNLNKNGPSNNTMDFDAAPQRDNNVKADPSPTENGELVNNQYYRVVERTPDAVDKDLGMESNTTEAMESGSESSSSGTMEPGMVPVKTESTSTYVAPNGTEVTDPNMLPNGIENVDPNMLPYMAPNAPGVMVPCEQVNSPGAVPAHSNPNMVPNMVPPINPNMVPMAPNMMPPMVPPMIPPMVPPMMPPMIPNMAPNMLPPMVPPIVPPMVPNMMPNMVPPMVQNPAAALTPRMGPAVPNVFATMDYKMATDAFASIASTLTSDMDSKGSKMPKAEANVPPNAEQRVTPNVPNMTQKSQSNAIPKQETTEPQSAQNAIGTTEPNTSPATLGTTDPSAAQGASGPIDPRMMANTMANMDPNMCPNMPAPAGPNGMEAMRAYLGPNSASNLARYMVKNMVPCPYRTIDGVHPVRVNARAHPYNPDVRQPCRTNAGGNLRVAGNIEVPGNNNQIPSINSRVPVNNEPLSNEVPINSQAPNYNDVSGSNENQIPTEVAIDNDEVQPTTEEPRERRRRNRVNSGTVIRELCRNLTRGRSNNRSTNRRTNRNATRNARSNNNPNVRRNGNRRVRRDENRSSCSTRPYTEYYDNRSNAEEECPLTHLQGPRRDLELLLNPQLATSLREQVPSTRTIVDTDGNGLVIEGNCDSNPATVKRQPADVTTRSTMSTIPENADEYNFVAACAILNEFTAREKAKMAEQQAENAAESGQQPAANNGGDRGGQNDMNQLVGTYPYQDYRASHEVYPAFHYVPNELEQIIHDYLYGLYLIQVAQWRSKVAYGCYIAPPGMPCGNFVPQSGASSENPSSENNTNADNHRSNENNGNADNHSSTENSETQGYSSIENNTNIESYPSIENNTNSENYSSTENITNSSKTTSIENNTNTSNNTSIENSTEVDNNAANWNNTNYGNNAQDYCYANAGNNEAGHYQQHPGNTAEDYYYEHAWNVANINYETACAFVASQCNFGRPNGRKPRQSGPNDDQKPVQRRSTRKGQNSGAGRTNANKSKDNQNDHQVNGGEGLNRTTRNETAELYRQLYECFEDDENHQ